MHLKPVYVEAVHLDDAWWQLIRKCFMYGHEYKVAPGGSYAGQRRFEFDFVTVLVKEPWKQLVPLMPEGNPIPPPASVEQCETYMADYFFTDKKSPNEDYRYGERLVAPKFRRITRPDLSKPHVETQYLGPGKVHAVGALPMGTNQYDEVIRKYAHGGPGSNQCTMEIAMPNDILLADPPCCRLIDTRIRYGKLHFVTYFRSWDLYAGFPVNLGGMELLKQMMVDDLNSAGVAVENGSMVAVSKGLHVYEQYYKLVESQLQMPIEVLRTEGEEIKQKGGLLF